MALLVPDDYAKNMSEGYPVEIDLIVDSSNRKQRPTVQKVSRVIKDYSGRMGSLRLMARGVNPEVAAPIAVRDVDVANSRAAVAKLLSIVPMWVVLAAFVCGMMLAIDTTAGERERGSLESLLLNPVPRRAIVVGKWLATSLFSGVGLTLTLIGCLGVVVYLPIEELGFSFRIDGQTVVGILAATLPLALMATALMLLLATFARSFKEANVTMQLLVLLPVLPTFIDSSGASHPWMFAIPILAQNRLMSEVLAGAPPSLALFSLAGAVSLAIGVIAVWATSRLFHKEGIIFGR
jgi:sodium transport system permease protein